MKNEKEIIKIREKINERFAKLNIDFDLISEEEKQNIKEEIVFLQYQLTKYPQSTVSGYYVPLTQKVYFFIYELLEYEKTHEPLFIYEEANHHYTLWPSKKGYENGTEKIADLKNEYKLRDWLRKMCA